MSDALDRPKQNAAEAAARLHRFREACVLQEIEGNPLTPDEIKMFEKFEREGWSDERILAHFVAQAKADAGAGL